MVFWGPLASPAARHVMVSVGRVERVQAAVLRYLAGVLNFDSHTSWFLILLWHRERYVGM